MSDPTNTIKAIAAAGALGIAAFYGLKSDQKQKDEKEAKRWWGLSSGERSAEYNSNPNIHHGPPIQETGGINLAKWENLLIVQPKPSVMLAKSEVNGQKLLGTLDYYGRTGAAAGAPTGQRITEKVFQKNVPN